MRPSTFIIIVAASCATFLCCCEKKSSQVITNDDLISYNAIVPQCILIEEYLINNLDEHKFEYNIENEYININFDNRVNLDIRTHNSIDNEFYINAWEVSFTHAERNEKFLSPAVFHDHDEYFIKYFDDSMSIYILSDKSYSNLRGVVLPRDDQSMFYQYSITIHDKSYNMEHHKIIGLIKIALGLSKK